MQLEGIKDDLAPLFKFVAGEPTCLIKSVTELSYNVHHMRWPLCFDATYIYTQSMVGTNQLMHYNEPSCVIYVCK